MYTKIAILVSILLLAVGLFIPLWYIGILGLVVLSIAVPFAGIFAGFLLDILYGAPTMLPALLSFPCTIVACLIGVLSLFLRTYIRS